MSDTYDPLAKIDKAETFDWIATLFGANSEWNDPSEYLEAIAEMINRVTKKLGLPSVSSQDKDALKYWRIEADKLDIEHDGAEEELCECGESLEDNEGYDGLCGNCADAKWAGDEE